MFLLSFYPYYFSKNFVSNPDLFFPKVFFASYMFSLLSKFYKDAGMYYSSVLFNKKT